MDLILCYALVHYALGISSVGIIAESSDKITATTLAVCLLGGLPGFVGVALGYLSDLADDVVLWRAE